MTEYRGSEWKKWDLHVHTPASLIQGYGGDDSWGKFINEIESLPEEIKVIGVNDYLFLDGYKKLIGEKNNGRMSNIELFLPVIELRLDKFGGSKNSISRVNYHIIFSDEIDVQIIEAQFLNALPSKYIVSPQYDQLSSDGAWAALPTKKSLEDLGNLIIGSVPEEEKAKFGSPLVEGFNNLCLNLNSINEILDSPYFKGKILTAVGKTEWADIKWNDQSIADKKTIINGADLVFISSESPEHWTSAYESLQNAEVNNRLLDCSDAHTFSDSSTKDRLGKCFTWIKADCTFEGLKQAVFEYEHRVEISYEKPIDPPIQIKSIKFKIPADSLLKSNNHSSPFCLRGDHEIFFSPFFTCITGGRGTGKSTLLNLLQNNYNESRSGYFLDNKIVNAEGKEINLEECVSVEGTVSLGGVEFLQQNEIEQFAVDPSRFKESVINRLYKQDHDGLLDSARDSVEKQLGLVEEKQTKIKNLHGLIKRIKESGIKLTSNKGLIDSFKNEEYLQINDELANKNRELQKIKSWRVKYENLSNEITDLVDKYKITISEEPNYYEAEIEKALTLINSLFETQESDSERNAQAVQYEEEINSRVKKLTDDLTDFLKRRGLSPENLADVSNANQRVIELEEEIPKAEKHETSLRKEIESISIDGDAANNFLSAITEQLKPVNDVLSGLSSEVKPIALSFKFDIESCKTSIISYIKNEVREINKLRSDHLEQALYDINLLSLGSKDDFIDLLDQSKQTSKILLEFFSEDKNYDLLFLEALAQKINVIQHGRIRVTYDGNPIENSSFGQRCTATIVILLLLGNTPVVIDEPEAHLDSSLIAKYLVDLIKKVTPNRQVIFATHNANFVVNGDAELIHCLRMRDDKKTLIESTSIENLTFRDRILSLEGGEEAFLKRETRYGID